MNHIYALVWNPCLGAWSIADEHARRRGKGSGAVVAAAALLLSIPTLAADLPTGGTVVSGSGQIGTPSANQMVIDQGSNKLAIDWQSFDIGTGHKVTFNQPGSDSIALNRVLGADGSKIMGTLEANGQVFLVNPNGVLFGQGASVNVGGLVASTLDIDNDDFEAGSHQFKGNGGNASVTNNGSIRAADGGSIALLGGTVSNNGVIVANQGTVALAAGNAVTLDFAGDGLLNVQVDEAVVDALVENHQLIKADGGQVLLTANAGDALLKTVINNTGVIEAQTLGEKDGKIVLLGSFDGGTVQVAGTLDASAPNGGDGGFIETSGAHVKVADSAKVTTKAAGGKTGTWLIDPNDFTIAASGGDMTGAAVSTAVQNNNFQIQTATVGTIGGNGDIHVNDAITWNSSNTLTLNAERNININAAITAQHASGKVALQYGQASTDGGTADYHIKAAVNLQSGQNFSTQKGSDVANKIVYTVVNDANALQAMNNNLSGNYAVGSNIDLANIANWQPVGGQSSPFTGQFDGLGHTLSNLTINRSTTDYVGLFGVIGSGSVIRNIGLVGGSVTGHNYVGGLVGDNFYSTISNAYATGSVTGNSSVGGLVGGNFYSTISNAYATGSVTGRDYVGGLVGDNYYSTISNAYATGSVTGNGSVGGLVGYNQSTISNAYATGSVSGTGYHVGGLVGQNYATITASFYATTDAAGNAINNGGASTGVFSGNAYGTGKTWLELTDPSTFSAWDTSVWTLAGAGANVDGYEVVLPYLTGITRSQDIVFTTLFQSGQGTTANPYGITTWQQLAGIDRVLGGGYTFNLLNNLSSSTAGYALFASATANGGAGWNPLGTSDNVFTDTFDGQSHTIGDLIIDRSTTNYVGLFGVTGSGSVIRNIGLVGGSVTGSSYVGGLVGYNYEGSISNAYATGNVTGNSNVGGLVGYSRSTISNAYATGNVTGTDRSVGGLVGYNYAGSISNAYATGSVTSTDNSVGGLVGVNYQGTISNAYATGSVTGDIYVGGLVGYTTGGNISNAYATGSVTGSGAVGGLVGLISVGTITASFYATTDAAGNAINNGGASTGVFSGNAYVTGKTWLELTDPTTFSAWDTSVWTLAGAGANVDGYEVVLPYLTGITRSQDIVSTTLFQDGQGTTGNPYNITTWQQLAGIDRVLGGGYTFNLLNNLSSSTAGYALFASATANDGAGWNPLGTNGNVFTGTFDGQSHTIGDLIIDRSTTEYVGLFGYTDNTSVIRNIGLVGGSVTGKNYVGGLVGVNRGSISNAYATGSVTGNNNVGGLVGDNWGSISNAYATGSVTGNNNNVGGLVGVNRGSISNAYATSSVTGSGNAVGGLVGNNGTGTIRNAYATGSVTGSGNAVGGLVGYNGYNGYNIINSFYATTNANGNAINTGLSGNGNGTGKTSAELKQASTFADWDIASEGGTDKIWRIYEGHTGPLLRSFLQSITVEADVSSITGKTYDGSAATGTLSYSSNTPSVTLNGSLTYATNSKNAGTYTTDNGLSINQGLYSGQQGYDISYAPSSASLTISKANLSVTGITANGKTYDGTTAATLSGTAGVSAIGSDVVSVSGTGVGTFADKNAGTGKAVTVTGYALTGSDANNYSIVQPTGLTATIDKANLTVTGVTAVGKTYDGSTAATLTGAASVNAIDSDIVFVTGTGVGTFADKNAGTGKAVTVTGYALTGSDANNYSIVQPTGLTATIDKANLTVTGVTAVGKTYDGSTAATLSGTATVNAIGSDIVSVTNTGVGTFADKNAGTGKAVTVTGYALTGSDANNYSIVQPTGLTATIDKANLTVTGVTAVGKTYDGSTAATLTGAASVNAIDSDIVFVTGTGVGTFADKNAGTGKAVTVTGYALTGSDANNYSIVQPTGLTATIDKANLTVTGVTAVGKTYDGSTAATLTGAASVNAIDSDIVFVTGTGVGTFADKNAGTGKAVTVTGYALTGSDANNYSIVQPTGLTATIDKADLTVTGITAVGKTYDGSTAATLSGTATVNAIGSDVVSVTNTGVGTFADKNAGTGKSVTVTGYALTGSDANNYSIVQPTGLTATIDKANLTVTANDASKTYDGQAFSGGNGVTYSGFVNGESETLLGGTLSYGGTAQGAVNAGNYVLSASGLTADNYAISYTDGSLDIAPSPANSSQPYIGVLASNSHAVSTEPKQQAQESDALLQDMLITNPLDDRLNLQVINHGIRLPEGI